MKTLLRCIACGGLGRLRRGGLYVEGTVYCDGCWDGTAVHPGLGLVERLRRR